MKAEIPLLCSPEFLSVLDFTNLFTHSRLVYIRSNSILYSHLGLGLPSGLVPHSVCTIKLFFLVIRSITSLCEHEILDYIKSDLLPEWLQISDQGLGCTEFVAGH